MTARLGYRMRNSLLGLLRTAGMCCALLFLQQTAHADLWAFVDERGVTHFAAQQLDERYALFFRGNDFDSERDGSNTGRQGAADVSTGPASPSGARLLAFFEVSHDYKLVRQHLRSASARHGVDYALLQAVIAEHPQAAKNYLIVVEPTVDAPARVIWREPGKSAWRSRCRCPPPAPSVGADDSAIPWP